MVSLLLNLNIFHAFSSVSIVNVDQVIVCWDMFLTVIIQIMIIYVQKHKNQLEHQN